MENEVCKCCENKNAMYEKLKRDSEYVSKKLSILKERKINIETKLIQNAQYDIANDITSTVYYMDCIEKTLEYYLQGKHEELFTVCDHINSDYAAVHWQEECLWMCKDKQTREEFEKDIKEAEKALKFLDRITHKHISHFRENDSYNRIFTERHALRDCDCLRLLRTRVDLLIKGLRIAESSDGITPENQ